MQIFIWTSFLLKDLHFLFYSLLFKVYFCKQTNFVGGIDLGLQLIEDLQPCMNRETHLTQN